MFSFSAKGAPQRLAHPVLAWPSRAAWVREHPAGRRRIGDAPWVKDVLDRVLAAAALLVLAPLFLAIALAIRIDSRGPAFYRQQRHGLNGRVIEVLKFRSMRSDRCDDGSSSVVRQATRQDPRITRVGHWLRRSSLDELPQLINVLLGDMSLVGPRPHAVAHNHYYAQLIDRYEERNRVKPGITGWAQVNGLRGETDTVEKMARRIAHDLDYVENRSLRLDLAILLKTLRVGFVHPEAR